jgi:hypothetical protein
LGLERGFDIKDNDLSGIAGHDLIHVFGADSTLLIGNQLANLSFVGCDCACGCH